MFQTRYSTSFRDGLFFRSILMICKLWLVLGGQHIFTVILVSLHISIVRWLLIFHVAFLCAGIQFCLCCFHVEGIGLRIQALPNRGDTGTAALSAGGILLVTGSGDILFSSLRRYSLSSPSEVAMTTGDVFLFTFFICRGKCEIYLLLSSRKPARVPLI